MRTAVLTAVLVLLLPPLANALNHPPVANAGEDQSIYNNSATCLDGSATDPDGESITDWLWVVESTPDGAVWGVGDPGRPFTCLLAYTPGIQFFSLVVSDGFAWSAPDTVTIRVIEDQLPTAMARADIMCGVVPLTVNFNGSGSFDPEGHPLQYVWKFGDSSEFSFDESPSHIFRRTGDFDVTLQVVDERGLVDVDALRITVLATAPAVPALPRSGPWLPGLLLSLAGPAQLARRVEAK